MPPSAPHRRHFDYMFWAHEEGFGSPYCLSQSGMPVPEVPFLAGLPIDVTHPCTRALPELQAQLAERFGVAAERVLVTMGASSAMSFAAMRWFRPGARVAVESPCYEALRALPEFFGAERRPLRREPENRWTIDPVRVREAFAGHSGPGHVMLTNLNNPTGAFLDADTIRAIAAEADRTGGVLVSSEVYMEYVPEPERILACSLAPNVVSIGSLTKAYGLGALRLGWMILGEGLLADVDPLIDISYLGYVDPPTPSLQAATVALQHLPELEAPIRRVEAESRPVFDEWLRSTPGITAVVPEHGIIAFPRIDGVPDTAGLASFLQREHQVDVVPGEFFELPGHLRLGCGIPEESLREALARLARGIEAWRAAH